MNTRRSVPYKWLLLKGFLILDVSNTHFSSKLNSKVLTICENKFPQLKNSILKSHVIIVVKCVTYTLQISAVLVTMGSIVPIVKAELSGE